MTRSWPRSRHRDGRAARIRKLEFWHIGAHSAHTVSGDAVRRHRTEVPGIEIEHWRRLGEKPTAQSAVQRRTSRSSGQTILWPSTYSLWPRWRRLPAPSSLARVGRLRAKRAPDAAIASKVYVFIADDIRLPTAAEVKPGRVDRPAFQYAAFRRNYHMVRLLHRAMRQAPTHHGEARRSGVVDIRWSGAVA